MNRKKPVVALGLFLAFASGAQATMLASGPLFGGTAQPGGQFSCRLYNAGSATITFTSRKIIDSAGQALAASFDSCGASLAPGKSCLFYVAPIVSYSYSCRVVTSGTDPALRGTADVMTSGGTVLVSQPLGK